MIGHQSLQAWKSAHFVARECFLLSRDCWVPWAGALFTQLQRSALSVQLNIAEGWAFGPTPTYTRHLSIAHGSAVETGELLSMARELRLAPGVRLDPIERANDRSRRTLLGLLRRRQPF